MTENETALTIAEEKELQAYLDEQDLSVAGEENLEPGDVGMPPRLRISQPNRPIQGGDEDAPAGSIVNTLTNEVYPNGLEIVPLVFLPRTRVLWPEVFSTENDPLCASDDGKIPAIASDNRALCAPREGPCSECLASRFGEDGDAPRCKLQRNFLVFLVEQEGAAILTMQSTGLNPARQLTALAKMQGIAKSVRLVTQIVKDQRGQWYVPAFSAGDKLGLALIGKLIEAKRELQNLVISADVAAEMRENGGGTAQEAEEYNPEEIEADRIPF